MKSALFAFAPILLLLAACDFSLAGDITPPPDAILSGEGTLAVVEAPASRPDLAAGAEIYANRCAPCHGVSGLGDGEQADQLPFFPSPLGDPNLARAASPEDWFRVLSAGRVQRYMPPFESTLTAQQRWDVLTYVYSLGWDEEILARGEDLYMQYPSDIDEVLIDESPIGVKLELIESLDLPAADAEVLTAYLQAKALGISGEAEQAETAPSTSEAAPVALGSFRGQVIYGSGNQTPDGLEVRLYGFDHTDEVVSEIIPVSADGSFAFDEIPPAFGRIFFVRVEYQGVSFISAFLTVEDFAKSYTLDVSVYDTTSETSQLAIEKIQLVFDFPEADIVRIVESVIISNLGDRAVVPEESGQPVLHFSLPPEAGNLAFQEGELGSRYIADETGFGDTHAVVPGIESYSLLFAYELPYKSSLSFPVSIDLPTRTVVGFLPEGEFEMRSENFQLLGSQAINDANYLVYSAEAGYFPGDEVILEFSGSHPLDGGIGSLVKDDSLLIGLVVLTAVVGIAWLWLRRLPVAQPRGVGIIMDEILALDARFEGGKLTKAAYAKRRAVLKARLRRELDKKSRP